METKKLISLNSEFKWITYEFLKFNPIFSTKVIHFEIYKRIQYFLYPGWSSHIHL